MFRKLVSIFVIIAILSTMALVGCSSAATTTTATTKASSAAATTAVTTAGTTAAGTTAAVTAKKFKIVCMPKRIGSPFYSAAETGMKQAAIDLNMDLNFTGPTVTDAAQQAKMLEDLINSGIDAIAIAPADAVALTPVLKKARDKGILILDWDSAAEPAVVDASVKQVDEKLYAQHIWDLLVKYMGTDEGEYAILIGNLSAANLKSWTDNGEAYAKVKYPKLKLVTERISCDDKQQVAYQKALELIKVYPNLKGIVGISTPMPLGAAQAVQEKGLQSKIAVVGSALPKDSKQYIMDGSLDGPTLWDPAKLGYLTMYVARQLLDKKGIKDGMDVPTIGKVSVLADGKTVIMGQPTDFTKDNVDQFNF